MAFIFKEHDGATGIWHADHVLNFHVKIHRSSIGVNSEGNLSDTDIAWQALEYGKAKCCPNLSSFEKRRKYVGGAYRTENPAPCKLERVRKP